ncbi:MAG: substrate-binding domain-containing protein [Chloroflexi bacterium]|nr:substrate-binding domain-containing protein [Chloroflexota bacterium]
MPPILLTVFPPDEIEHFCRSFSPMPVVSFAVPGRNVVSYMSDNEGGMRAIVRHLIEEHKYARIAFIRGPRGQVEAEQRYQAYREELKAHSIRFEEHLVVDGDYSPESGRAAVRTLLDERGMKLQAIIAANDRMAFGVLEALQQRGIRVPDEIALTGFDDVGEAQSMGVPLTTVHQSFYEVGRRSLEGLLKRIKGEAVEDVILPSRLVVRWSCGCLPEGVQRAIVLPKEVAHTGRLENKRSAAIRALFLSAGISEGDPAKALYEDTFGRTWDVFLASLRETDRSDAFLKMMQTTVEVLQRYGHDFYAWQNVISTFRKYALGGITSTTTMLRAENLFQQARMLVGELSQRAQAYRRLQFRKAGRNAEQLQFFDGVRHVVRGDWRCDLQTFSHPRAGALVRDVLRRCQRARLGLLPAAAKLPPACWNTKRTASASRRRNSCPPPGGSCRAERRRKTAATMRWSCRWRWRATASASCGRRWGPRGLGSVRARQEPALQRAPAHDARPAARAGSERSGTPVERSARPRRGTGARARCGPKKPPPKTQNSLSPSRNGVGARRRWRARRGRLSSLKAVENLHDQILDELCQVVPYDRGVLFMEDVNGSPHPLAQAWLARTCRHAGLPFEDQRHGFLHHRRAQRRDPAGARRRFHRRLGAARMAPARPVPGWACRCIRRATSSV